MQEDVFRGFIALSLPSEIKTCLEHFTSEAKPVFPACRFASIKNLHITLQFLGNNVQKSLIPSILDVMQASTANTAPFSISLGKPSTFPHKGRPRVFYIGIDEGKHELTNLANNLRAGLSELGFEENKPFRAHITLARGRGYRGNKQRSSSSEGLLWEETFRAFRNMYPEESKNLGLSGLHWPVSEVLLMESKLLPQGPLYSVLGSVQLPSK